MRAESAETAEPGHRPAADAGHEMVPEESDEDHEAADGHAAERSGGGVDLGDLGAMTASIARNSMSGRTIAALLTLSTVAMTSPLPAPTNPPTDHTAWNELMKHFEPATARIVDALIEGLSIHRALDNVPQDEAIASSAIERIPRKPIPASG